MIQPINKQILVQFNASDARGVIFVPSSGVDGATSCLVHAVGNKVNPQIKKGDVLLCMTGFLERQTPITIEVIGGHEVKLYSIDESKFYGVKKNNIIYSFGRTVIIQRIAEPINSIIQQNEVWQSQSLWGIIRRHGLSRSGFRTQGLSIGATIRLSQWESSMIQIELEDGSHGMIVNEKDLLFKQ